MILQKSNFGLTGQLYAGYDDESYDSLFKNLKEKRAEKKEEKEDKKQDSKERKEDRRSERAEKREAAGEKRRLKNELKQTQIDEKKAQLSLLNQQGQSPAPGPEGSNNSMWIVAAVAGAIVIAGAGYIMINRKPVSVTAPALKQSSVPIHT